MGTRRVDQFFGPPRRIVTRVCPHCEHQSYSVVQVGFVPDEEAGVVVKWADESADCEHGCTVVSTGNCTL